MSTTNSPSELFVSTDTGPCQIKKGIAVKTIKRVVSEAYLSAIFFVDRRAGVVSSQWKPLIRVASKPEISLPTLEWENTNVVSLGFNRSELEPRELFRHPMFAQFVQQRDVAGLAPPLKLELCKTVLREAMPGALQFQGAEREMRLTSGRTQASPSEPTRATLRMRLRRRVRSGGLWPPFDRRLQLVGARVAGAILTSQAFRSHGHERIPEPLKLFVVTLYTDALCYGAFASPMAFLFFQGRGVIQGRPASGAQLAVATGGFYQGTDCLQCAAIRGLELAALRQAVLSAVPSCPLVSLACPPANCPCPAASCPVPARAAPLVNLARPPLEGYAGLDSERFDAEKGSFCGLLGAVAGAAATGLGCDLPGAPLFHERLVTGLSLLVAPGPVAALTADGDRCAEGARCDDAADARWSGARGAAPTAGPQQVGRFRRLPTAAELEQLKRGGAFMVGGAAPASPGAAGAGAAGAAAAPAGAAPARQGGEAGVVARAGRLPDGDRSIHKHGAICRVLDSMISVDQLSAPALQSAELLCRYLQLIEDARAVSPSAPVYLAADECVGWSARRGGSAVAPQLQEHVAANLRDKAAGFKGAGKAKEELKLRRGPIGGGKGGPAYSGGPGSRWPRAAGAGRPAAAIMPKTDASHDARCPMQRAFLPLQAATDRRRDLIPLPCSQPTPPSQGPVSISTQQFANDAVAGLDSRVSSTGKPRRISASQLPQLRTRSRRPHSSAISYSRRGAAKEFLASSLSYAGGEAPSPVVKCVRSRVDIPDVDAAAPAVDSALDPIGRGCALGYESRMMKAPDEQSRALDSEPPVTPHMDEVLKSDPCAYHLLIADPVKANMLGFTYRPKDLATPFFVAKKSRAQRLVWDARVPNRRFRVPPPVSMGASAARGRVQLPGDRDGAVACAAKLYCAQADVKNYVYTLGLPTEIGLFFSLPPVSQVTGAFASLGRFIDRASRRVCCRLERPGVLDDSQQEALDAFSDVAMGRPPAISDKDLQDDRWELNPDFI
ncbi:unnamed protein product [Prorocentrum cordatum]|uniref:Uncharacterized protein n=1 Tax=Prorocentrum cordatum TaxID=2364126 RepID=A0ABN9UJN6_9DINO|nr:unnamed protein product [Polarella glacialis]